MDFSLALGMLKNGDKIFREGWNGKNQVLELQRPDENSKMTLPYIFIKTVQGDLVPWLASQTDLLAEDWKAESKEENQGPTPMTDKEAELEGDSEDSRPLDDGEGKKAE